jgi:tetratricopeptide (TPR) repeat protein
MRWVRHHKQWVAAAAVLLVLTAVGLAVHNGQIRREQARTIDQLGMTRDALRELLTVSGENLAFIANTEKLREYLAQLVLDRYQQLGDKFPADPGIRLETALVWRVIGGIGRITGQFSESQDSYRKAIEELTALRQKDPRHAECRRWLVETLIDRGELYHMNGRTIQAEHDFHAAINEADKLLELPLPLPDHRSAKAAALINLSEILSLKNQASEASQAAKDAVDLLEPLAAPPADPKRLSRNRWLLAMALTDRGIASIQAGDGANAAGDFDAGERVVSQISREDELYDDAQFQIASIANQRGELLSKDHAKLADADGSFEQASAALSRLIDDHKLIAHYREEMTLTHIGRATVHLAMNRVQDAKHDCQSALDLVSRLIDERKRKGAPESPENLSLLARILALQSRVHIVQGKPAEGRKTLEQAAETLSRAIQIDPAREIDKVRLEEIRTSLAQEKR